MLEDGVGVVYNQRKDSGNNVTMAGAEAILKRSNIYREINQKVGRLTVLVELFESCEKNMQYINNDVKNLIDVIKLEEM